MKKVILKTALLTLSGIIALMLVVYGVFAYFFPASLADAYRGVFNYDLALKYSERVFEKDKSMENRIILVRDAINAQNEEKIIQYAPSVLFYSELSLDDRSVISEKYCVALYNSAKSEENESEKTHKYEKAIQEAFKNTFGALSTGYGEINAVRALIFTVIDECSDSSLSGGVLTEKLDFLNSLLEQLKTEALNEDNNFSDDESDLILGDITKIEEFIAKIGEKNQ